MADRVAAPGYRCQICKYSMPLIDIPQPKFLDPVHVKVTCHNCNSHFLLKVSRVPNHSECIIKVTDVEPGSKAIKILTQRGAELERERNRTEEEQSKLNPVKEEHIDFQKGLVDPEKEEIEAWHKKKNETQH